MRNIWDGNARKFYYWLVVELAVLEARVILGQIPQTVFERIKKKSALYLHGETGQKLWLKITNAIERRDKIIGHDLNAFLEIMRLMIVLPKKQFLKIINCKDDEKFNAMVDEALEKCRGNAEVSFFHNGMTSYDTEEPAMALLFKEACAILDNDLAQLEAALISRAYDHYQQLMIFRTHGQHAQPGTFGIKVINWLEDVRRTRMRLKRVAEEYRVVKLSGAVGTYSTLDPEVEKIVGNILELNPIIATQIISITFRTAIINEMAISSAVIEKIAHDLWLLSQTEIREVQEAFGKKQKGSSAMPHKKNPIGLEKLFGLAKIVRAFAHAMMELIDTHNEREISHSSAERIIHQTVFATLDHQITTLVRIINTMNVFPERMAKNIEMTHGVIASQKLTMLLESKGMSVEDAYRIVQQACFDAMKEEYHLRDIILNGGYLYVRPVMDLIKSGKLTVDEVEEIFKWEKWVEHEDYIYKRAGLEPPRKKSATA